MMHTNQDQEKEQEKLLDQGVRHEAALYFADGNDRQAINLLIQRINKTNGYCDVKNWLMLLDIYQTMDQRGAYEKLAVFFSNRFNFSPPAWLELNKKNQENVKTGYWRNALIVEGSPLDILDEKARDFIRASKEEGSSRIDLSRMKLSDDEDALKQELERLLSIMKRLRKIKKPTLLMGDGEVYELVEKKINKKQGSYESERIYWEILFEVSQWRGEEESFNKLVDEFSERFDYCPVGYEKDEAIAVNPSQEHSPDNDFVLKGLVDDAEKIMKYLQNTWEEKQKVEISLSAAKKMTTNCARQVAEFLRASLESGFSQHQIGGELANAKQNEVVFTDTPETIASLFEITGVVAYADIQYQHAKLRELNFKNPD